MSLEILHAPASRPNGAPPLLFVHGSYCAAWVWVDYFMPFLAEAGFDCHALSLRGHGGSSGSMEWACLNDYVADVEEAAAGLDQPPVLIGHSMGGLIAQHYVSRGNPASGLALLASTPPSGLASSSMHMMAHAPDVLFQLGLLQSLGPGSVSTDIMSRALFSPESDPAEAAAFLPRLEKESSRLSAELMFPPRPWPPRGNKIPALVIGGDADKFLPISAFQEAASHWHAELHILPGAPHALMMDSKWRKPCARIVVDWLKG